MKNMRKSVNFKKNVDKTKSPSKISKSEILVLNDRMADVQKLVLSFKNPANPNVDNTVIRNVSFHLKRGEVYAIIGESGSGKSVLASTLYGLSGENSVINSGTINVLGKNVEKFSRKKWERSKLRGRGVSAVFQNPMTTLNPTMKIGKQVMEGLLVNKIVRSRKKAYKLSLDYLIKMRINRPKLVMKMYPHELSGGMKQRIVIASIIACQPKLLILDEPTTALDPTVQAEILEIVKEIVKETNMSVIFITHDIGVVASIANRIAIMYAGQIIEEGLNEEIIFNPKHPYTWGLIMSMPDVNKGDRLATIRGSVPGTLNYIEGDAFAPRNDWALGIDFTKEPPIFKISPTHYVKSWLMDKRAPKDIHVPKIIKNRWNKFEKMKKTKGMQNG